MASTSPADPLQSSSNNLLRLGRGSSLSPSWDFTDASQFLSSGASSSRRPIDYRIQHTKDQAHFYMERLLQIKPEGLQAVREGEMRMRQEQRSVPKDDDFYVLAFWKRTRFFFEEQLHRLTGEQFDTPPTPTLSEVGTDYRLSVWAERRPVLEHAVENWLRTLRGELCGAAHMNVNPNLRHKVRYAEAGVSLSCLQNSAHWHPGGASLPGDHTSGLHEKCYWMLNSPGLHRVID